MSMHLPINPSGPFGHFCRVIGQHSPLILIGAAAIGAVSSCVMAVKATTKAEELLAEEKEAIAEQDGISAEEVELTPRQIFRICWKLYVAPTVCLLLSIIFMFMSLKISNSRNLALAGLYATAQDTMRRYEDKVIETVGESGNEKIKAEVRKQRLKDFPVPDGQDLVPGEDLYLCMDEPTSRYWVCNKDSIYRARDMINEAVKHCMYISLNEFYDLVGLARCGLGDETGWTAEEPMELSVLPGIASNGHPCYCVNYTLAEKYNKKGYLF